jgi:hypothetical protein
VWISRAIPGVAVRLETFLAVRVRSCGSVLRVALRAIFASPPEEQEDAETDQDQGPA